MKLKLLTMFTLVALLSSCAKTDDTVMTLAVARWIMESETLSAADLVKSVSNLGRKYPNAGYGPRFMNWIWSDNPQPNNSYGNGAAMRVSTVALYAQSLNETLEISYISMFSNFLYAKYHNHEIY